MTVCINNKEYDDVIPGMIGKTLKSVILSDDKEKITFEFEDFSQSFGVEGDCCSYSWIEHLEMPDVKGAILLDVVDSDELLPWDRHVCADEINYSKACGHDTLQVYHTKFQTTKGEVILEYRNDSNGYYGGNLVALNE